MTAVDEGEPTAAPGRRRWPPPTTTAMLAGLLYLPFIGLGYGTDIDITNILRSGESILEGRYRYSRPPGAFPHELVTGLLERLGGAVLVNLGSVIAAVVTLVALARIVEHRHGARAASFAVVVVATQPWFWVAATSLGDYLYALAALLVGIDLAQRDRRVPAALAFGLAVGFRSTTALLVAAWLLAEITGDDRDADRVRAAVRMGILAAVVGLAFFVPPWLSVGRTAQFLQNQLQAGEVSVMVARWGVKNLAFFGVATLAVLAVRLPVLWTAVARFRSLVLVRFALFAAVATEILYLRFPWKPVHLVPMIVCVAVLLAASPRTSTKLVAVVVASHLALAVVSVTIAEPDVADAATTGRFAPGLTSGVVVNEIDCRLDPPDVDPQSPVRDGGWPDLDSPAADFAAVRVFACQARSWRAGAGPSAEAVRHLATDSHGTSPVRSAG